MQKEVERAVELLKQGKTFLYPTDTVWGLGCDATNAEAVKRIYDIKKREDNKALIVLIASIDQLWDYVAQIPEIAWDIVEFSEKPVTIIYPKGKNLAPNLMGEDGSIGIRLVKDEFCKKVIQKLRKPLVSTSANISGEASPAIYEEISEPIKNAVDYIVDWRRDDTVKKHPSTVMKLEMDGQIKFLRK